MKIDEFVAFLGGLGKVGCAACCINCSGRWYLNLLRTIIFSVVLVVSDPAL